MVLIDLSPMEIRVISAFILYGMSNVLCDKEGVQMSEKDVEMFTKTGMSAEFAEKMRGVLIKEMNK